MPAIGPSAFRCALLAACVGLSTPAAVSAQNSALPPKLTAPAFEVATIKPTDPERTQSSIGLNQGGSFQARAITLRELIQFAYDLGYFAVDQRIVGGPKWIGTARFDLDAKPDEQTATAFVKIPIKKQLPTQQAMIRALLADRFKLRLHHETRVLPVLILVPAHGGPNLTASASADPDDPFGPDGPPGNWKAKGVSMDELASGLSALTEVDGRIVIDRTGIKGRFDFTLKWTPDSTSEATPATTDNGLKQDPAEPSLLKALEEQLGLKLEASKQPVDVLVIDSAELPSAN
ncbi:MAG: TIGR03435 family protein [Terracidiphilus sp.]